MCIFCACHFILCIVVVVLESIVLLLYLAALATNLMNTYLLSKLCTVLIHISLSMCNKLCQPINWCLAKFTQQLLPLHILSHNCWIYRTLCSVTELCCISFYFVLLTLQCSWSSVSHNDTLIIKKVLRGTHCTPALVRRSQFFFAPPQTPFPGVREGQNLISWRWSHLYLRTQFGEDRSTQFRVIVVTHPHRPPVRYRQGRLQYTAP